MDAHLRPRDKERSSTVVAPRKGDLNSVERDLVARGAGPGTAAQESGASRCQSTRDAPGAKQRLVTIWSATHGVNSAFLSPRRRLAA